MRSSGAHTHPDGGGGLGAAVLIVAVAVAVSAAAGPVMHAVGELVHIVLIAVMALAGLAVAGLSGYVTWRWARASRSRTSRVTAVSFHPPVPARAAKSRTAPRELPAPPQIHLHLHGPVTAEDIAALIAGQLGHVEHQAVEAAEDD